MEYNVTKEEVQPIASTSTSSDTQEETSRSRVIESLAILQDQFIQYYQSDSFPRSIPEARAQFDTLVEKVATPFVQVPSATMRVLKWKPTSEEELEIAETKLLTYLRSSHRGYYVDIGEGYGLDNNRIWTIVMDGPQPPGDVNLEGETWTTRLARNLPSLEAEPKVEKMPLVLIHGFGCGSGIWALNFDSFAANRKVYAFDILGFGRSSRPMFTDSEVAEEELVESIERWRKSVGLNQKFILLGHSFGGYLSLAYALRHPDLIERLILADPWGVSTQTSYSAINSQIQLPPWLQLVSKFIFHKFSPLAALRAAGPWGPQLIQKFKSDMSKKFEALTGEENSFLILDYVYHCNAQEPPSGELAFKSLSSAILYAKNPMVNRIPELPSHIDLTFIYGSQSWVDSNPGAQLKQSLTDRIVQVHTIHGAGHHVYADDLVIFNDLVNSTCKEVDEIVAGVFKPQEMENEVANPATPPNGCEIA